MSKHPTHLGYVIHAAWGMFHKGKRVASTAETRAPADTSAHICVLHNPVIRPYSPSYHLHWCFLRLCESLHSFAFWSWGSTGLLTTTSWISPSRMNISCSLNFPPNFSYTAATDLVTVCVLTAFYLSPAHWPHPLSYWPLQASPDIVLPIPHLLSPTSTFCPATSCPARPPTFLGFSQRQLILSACWSCFSTAQ